MALLKGLIKGGDKMIKKIDANKYGVVRYAISSIEDIADLPREVSVGSEAILVNEDGEKKFKLGSDGWVEVVEVKEYDEDKLRDILEDAKVGYGGIEYETLEERLERDFDNAYSVLDNRTYVEYEGCRITAKDSLNGLQKETVVKGRTLQNLRGSDGLINGEWKNGEITFKPLEGTLDFVNFSFNLTQSLKNSTQYTIVYFIKTNTLSREFIACEGGNSSNRNIGSTRRLLPIGSTGVVKCLITTKSQGDCTYLTAFCTNAMSGEITFYNRPLLLEGDYTQTPLEELPFIEGIESVGDKSKNLFDGKIEGGTINVDTGLNSQYSSTLRTTGYIKVKENTGYATSFNIDYVKQRTTSGNAYTRIYYYDSNKNFISAEYITLSFVAPSNCSYVRWLMYSQIQTNEIENVKQNLNLQIEEGTQATAYEPYYDGYKVSGKSCGKNLYRGINNVSYRGFSEGAWVFVNGDQQAYGNRLVTHSTKFNLPLGDYVFNHNGENLIQIIKNKEEEVIGKGKIFTVTSINDTYCIRAKVRVDNELVEFKEIQLEEATTPTPYEPYKESTYSYILDEPLRSLPNGVCDEIDLEKGVVTRRVGRVVLDGSESWREYNTTNESYNEAIVSLSFECGNFYQHNSMTNNCPQTDTHRVVCVGERQIYYRVPKSVGSDIESFKRWLQANPTTVYYELANPTTEYLIKDDKFVTLPNGVKDEISHNSVLRKVGKVVLDGSKVYESGTNVQGIFRWAYSVPGAKKGGSCICSILDYVTPRQTWQEPFKDGITINSENSTILIYMDKYKETGKHMEEVSALLDGLEVYYELEEPYTEPLNLNEVILNATRLKSYEPITHITSDNYLPPTIKTQVPSDFNAVVLGLKSNNEALTSQVMSLRQTNDELEATNREQDDVIDVTLLALDEVYGMIDEGEIETMSMGSPMVNVYVKMIKRGIKTLDEVPAKYRAEVEELI